MSNLGQILVAAASGMSPQAMQQAQESLNEMQNTNPQQFILELSIVLASDAEPQLARQLSGLQLKNALMNANQNPYLVDIWAQIDQGLKLQIRNNALGALASPIREIRSSASQAVAIIAQIDIPQNQWPDLLGLLVQNATNVNEDFREASLMTLGYICEDLPPQYVPGDQTNAILTAIVASAGNQEEKQEIKYVALKALRNSLPFAKQNFQDSNERAVLLQLVINLCENMDPQIKNLSLQTLCDIASLYYDEIQENMGIIWNTTYNAIDQGQGYIQILGIEFWNIISDIERERTESQDMQLMIRGYCNQASDLLVPLLLQHINNYNFNDDEWNVQKASASTIGQFAYLLTDKVAMPCVEFIHNGLMSNDDKWKVSAVLVLGQILEGPDEQKLHAVLESLFSLVLQMLQDNNYYMRQTTAWTVSKICELHSKFIIKYGFFDTVMNTLISLVQDQDKIACHACWAIINLIERTQYENLMNSQKFNEVFNSLINAASKPTQTDQELRTAAFSAISTMYERAPVVCISCIISQIPTFITWMKQISQTDPNNNMFNLICSVLQSAFVRVTDGSILENQYDDIMKTIFYVFQVRGWLFDEAFQCVGALAQNIGSRFNIYFEEFARYLIFGLQSQNQEQLCKAATICVGDIARSLEENIATQLNGIIVAIANNLQAMNLATDIKIQSIESLADIAAHAPDSFNPYLEQVLPLIEQAANASTQLVNQNENPDLFDYMISLRQSICEFYTGLYQGITQKQYVDIMFNSIDSVINYIYIILQDQYLPSDELKIVCFGLIGDISIAYQGRAKDSFNKFPDLLNYIKQQESSSNKKLSEYSTWASGLISRN